MTDIETPLPDIPATPFIEPENVSEMYPDTFKYTVWNKTTGIIDCTGNTSFIWALWNVFDSETQNICLEDEYDFDTYQFDVNTHLPIECVRKKTQEELRILINKERIRRINVGKTFNGIYVTGSDQDRANLESLAFGSTMRLQAGLTDTINFRDGNNNMHVLAPQQVIGIWVTAAAYVSEIYDRSWALKAMDPIPQNYEDDIYWP